jgi:hypothetical protein
MSPQVLAASALSCQPPAQQYQQQPGPAQPAWHQPWPALLRAWLLRLLLAVLQLLARLLLQLGGALLVLPQAVLGCRPP